MLTFVAIYDTVKAPIFEGKQYSSRAPIKKSPTQHFYKQTKKKSENNKKSTSVNAIISLFRQTKQNKQKYLCISRR